MTQHVMIDLETMGTNSFVPILSIGAVKFDPTFPGDEFIFDTADTFYQTITLESNEQYGLRPDADTIMWWLRQSAEARAALQSEQAVQLDEALIGFEVWFGEDKPVWGNGASFDNVVLSNAYKVTKLPRPWSYRSDRCFRTIKELRPRIKPEFVGTKHNALDDAIHQVRWLRLIHHALGLFVE